MKSIIVVSSLALSTVLAITGCVGGEGAETESIADTQQAVTMDSAKPAPKQTAAAVKKGGSGSSSAAATSASLYDNGHTVVYSGSTLNKLIVVPAHTTLTCYTTNGTATRDPVMALIQPTVDTARDPCSSPFTDEIRFNTLAIDDDGAGRPNSLVSWTNNNGNSQNVRLLGFIYGNYSDFGPLSVTCSVGGTTTENFMANSWWPHTCSSSTQYTTGSSDPVLISIPASVDNGNGMWNDDCSKSSITPSPNSCLENLSTSVSFWSTSLCGYGSSGSATVFCG